jgi:hypothetical protein
VATEVDAERVEAEETAAAARDSADPGNEATANAAGPASEEEEKEADPIAGRIDREVRAVGLPIGWDQVQMDRLRRDFDDNFLWALVSLLVGWAMVGFAATLGAPFWFDLLGKIMVVRSTVKPTEKSPDEVSKDGGTGGAPKPPKADEEGEGDGKDGG